MPLTVAHGLVGASLVAAIHPRPKRLYAAPLLLGGLLANAADFDFLLVFALHTRAWHRGFSHSMVLALFVCLIFVLLFGKHRLKQSIAYGLAFASHGILDYATTKEGGGIELLWPFDRDRLMLGWWGLSEVPSQLTAFEIMKALLIEFAIFAPLLLLVLLLRRSMARRPPSPAGAT